MLKGDSWLKQLYNARYVSTMYNKQEASFQYWNKNKENPCGACYKVDFEGSFDYDQKIYPGRVAAASLALVRVELAAFAGKFATALEAAMDAVLVGAGASQ